MKRNRIHAAILLGLFSAGALSGHAAAAEKQRTARGELVHGIVMKWGDYVQETYRTDVRRWATDMVPLFARVPIRALREAAEARTFEGMHDALLAAGATAGVAKNAGAVPAKALGDTNVDLSFTPVTPCRILDTRNLSGPIQADATLHMDIVGLASFSTYGGADGNCNISNIPNIAALAVNFTVVAPAAPGYVTAYPFNKPRPLAATVNYATGEIRGNFAIVQLDQGPSQQEISLYTYAQTHIVGDVVGYFIRPEKTALSCVDVNAPLTQVNANSIGVIVTALCPTGYEATGGGCETAQNAPIITSRMQFSPDGDSWRCAIDNRNNVFVVASAHTRCCRTPGR